MAFLTALIFFQPYNGFCNNKKLFVTETSNFQVKFHFNVASHYWYFKPYRYFILRLTRVTCSKLWWKKIASSTTLNFAITGQFYLNFSKRKFLSNIKISIGTYLFYKKSSVKN